MTAIAPRRKGPSPGVLRPTETGDGLIAKVRAPGGRLTLDQAATLAVAARACGNGRLLLSARANFHIRGVSEATLADLAEQGRATSGFMTYVEKRNSSSSVPSGGPRMSHPIAEAAVSEPRSDQGVPSP